jgi:WXXGXW repeat (2 copies)
MKKRIFVICALAAAFIVAGLLSQSDSIAAPKKVWTPEHKVRTGTVIPGHWRPANKQGYVWVAGKTANGTWITGYWKPAGAAPVGKIWVKGYWQNGKWHDGRWAPKKKGTWVQGHHGHGGRWIPGHYK